MRATFQQNFLEALYQQFGAFETSTVGISQSLEPENVSPCPRGFTAQSINTLSLMEIGDIQSRRSSGAEC